MRRATNSRWFFAARRIRSRNAARRAIADEARPKTTAGETRHRARRTGNRCGRVVAARVVTGSDYPRLDAATRDAVLASRCAAQVENGTPTPMRARVPITFNLDE
ncbi:energy transducer TonB [Burkholderia cenocepacia]|nr:energy transducer TonB [Burkholderia cenocepacia]